MTRRPAQRPRAFAIACLTLAALACGRSESGEDALDAETSPLGPVLVGPGPEAAVQIQLATYEGSGQVVEPDVVYAPGGWRGYEYWMAINPFPFANEYWENASIFASHDGLTWVVPDGLKNPVVPPPSNETYYNSDPDLVLLPDTSRLLLFDRAVTRNVNRLRVAQSSDGVHWSGFRNSTETPLHELVSPAVVVMPRRKPRLWSVNAGKWGCNASSGDVQLRKWPSSSYKPEDLLEDHWGAPLATDLKAPEGWVLWHLDVFWLPERKEFWSVFPAHPVGRPCSDSDLFVARSRDGLHWETLPDPIVRRGIAWFAQLSIYRSSAVYDAAHNELRVWFSGQAGDYSWRLGYQAFPAGAIAREFDMRGRRGRG